MRITIVLPGMWPVPSGGLKLQYEYAAGLAERGHRITIVQPMASHRMIGVGGTMHYAYVLVKHRALGHRIIPWFALARILVAMSLSPFPRCR